MPKRTAIITGGNSGLGYQCAKAIAVHHDWHVVIACRDWEKANKAVKAPISERVFEKLAVVYQNTGDSPKSPLIKGDFELRFPPY